MFVWVVKNFVFLVCCVLCGCLYGGDELMSFIYDEWIDGLLVIVDCVIFVVVLYVVVFGFDVLYECEVFKLFECDGLVVYCMVLFVVVLFDMVD